MRLGISAILLAAGIAGQVALAQTACSPTVRPVTAISLDGHDPEFFEGLSASLLLGLTPRSFPYEAVVKQSDTCTRGEFEANGEMFRVYGSPPDSPPRWAIGKDPRRIAYMAIIPSPAGALKWARQRVACQNGVVSFNEPGLYALAVTNGEMREVFGFFDEAPGDDQLKWLFKDALEGKLPRLATFDESTRKTEFSVR